MRIGKHRGNEQKDKEWNLGNFTIDECDHYKYLGTEITSDGKNKSNLEKRKNKMNSSTIAITTVAESEVLRKMLLEPHNKNFLPAPNKRQKQSLLHVMEC